MLISSARSATYFEYFVYFISSTQHSAFSNQPANSNWQLAISPSKPDWPRSNTKHANHISGFDSCAFAEIRGYPVLICVHLRNLRQLFRPHFVRDNKLSYTAFDSASAADRRRRVQMDALVVWAVFRRRRRALPCVQSCDARAALPKQIPPPIPAPQAFLSS